MFILLSSVIHFFFSSATSVFSVILKEGTVGRFFFIDSAFIISFNAIFPNNLPIIDCLYFFLPNAISSHFAQCCIICETLILPHCAALFSLRELILVTNSSLVVLSNIDFIFVIIIDAFVSAGSGAACALQ